MSSRSPRLSAFWPRQATAGVFGIALAVRLLVVAWAATRVPPTADGKFYHVVAGRIAEGEGYTWLWPDGVVTFAAHYPVGYPALLGAVYFLFGQHPVWAMVQNAFLGAAGAAAMCGVAREVVLQSPFRAYVDRGAWVAGLTAAFLPTLVLYVPGLMTEGAVAAVVALGLRLAVAGREAAGTASARRGQGVLLGLLFGGAALLRPQSILLAPVVGWLAVPPGRGARSRLLRAAGVTAIALLACLPWTLRNCQKMERCLFVSANGGWNLLIGTYPEGRGAWVPIDGERVPAACRTVFQEAAKDRCFGQAAVRRVADAPFRWLSLVPAKLSQTFDFTAAAADHLREASVLTDRSYKWTAGLELVSQRILLGLGAFGLVAWARCRRDLRESAAQRALTWGLLGLCLVGFAGVSAVLGWGCLLGLTIRSGALRGSVGVMALAAAFLLTAAVHGVFFGAGRYSLPLLLWVVPLPALGVLALQVLTGALPPGDTSGHGPH